MLAVGGLPLVLAFNATAAATAVDRLVVMEDLTQGQRIRGFTLEVAAMTAPSIWINVLSAASIGRYSSGPCTCARCALRL